MKSFMKVLVFIVFLREATAIWNAAQGLSKCFAGLAPGSATTQCVNKMLERTCNQSIEARPSVQAACVDATTDAKTVNIRRQCCFSCYMKLLDKDTYNKALCRELSNGVDMGKNAVWTDQPWCNQHGYTPCYTSYPSCAEVLDDLTTCPRKCFNLR